MFLLTFVEHSIATAGNKVYLLNNDIVAHTMTIVGPDPAIDYVVTQAATMETISGSLPAGSPLNSAWISYGAGVFTVQSTDDSIKDAYRMTIVSTCDSSASGSDLVGQSVQSQYDLTIHSYTGSFTVANQAYLLTSDALTFNVSPIVIDPVDATLTFDYTAEQLGGSPLPTGLINFDNTSL